MKPVYFLCGILPALLLAACSSGAGSGLINASPSPTGNLPALVSRMTACTTAKTPACGSNYAPVCGVYQSSGRQQRRTYDNACNACSSANVIGFTSGQC
ncbi:MAG TPA: hypothetical protein PLB10_10430 [Thiolinea sp.]|nr:hypothetical protein [Thiolinea sp.]